MRSDKHQQTHAAIIHQALRDACQSGIERLSFTALATSLGMSKNGVYGHFGSLGALQLEVVEAYCQRFERQTFGPALAVPAGLPRLRAIFTSWCRHIGAGMWLEVLPFYSAGESAGPAALARQAWIKALRAWRKQLAACVRDAVEAGQLNDDTDRAQLADDIYGLIVTLHHEVRVFNNFEAVRGTAARFRSMLGLSGAAAEQGHRPDHQYAVANSWLNLLRA